jgi:zona occludens toxin (predicted ATPase)
VNSGATIFDDRETVEFLRDHPHLLAIADAVRATQRRQARPWASPLRVGLAAAVLTAAAIGAFVLTTNSGTNSGRTSIDDSGFVAPTPVANAAAADALLTFNVVLPSNATPASLTVSVDAQALDGRFDSTPNGSYVLDEQENNLNWTVADLQRLDQHWHPGATHSVVVIEGVHVLVQEWSDGSVEAQWFRGDGADRVLSWVEGPDTEQGQSSGQTFNEQQALSVVSDIISRGG